MPLTLFQELALLTASDDTASPPGPVGARLSELIYGASVGYSVDFLTATKDTSGSEPATAYVSKVSGLCNRINRKAQIGNDIDSLKKIFISIIGDTATPAAVNVADDTQWETFVRNNIAKVFDVAAGATKQEKDAYTAL